MEIRGSLHVEAEVRSVSQVVHATDDCFVKMHRKQTVDGEDHPCELNDDQQPRRLWTKVNISWSSVL